MITAKIVKNGFISKPDEFIAEEDYDFWMHRGIPRKGSVIMTTEAPLGEVARIPSDDRLAFAQRIIVLEPRQEILDAGFLYYALRDSVLMGRIKSRATGTTVTACKEKVKPQIGLAARKFGRRWGERSAAQISHHKVPA